MKADTHPTYHDNATIKCACGSSFVAGSTKESLSTELCSSCHPFYTGQQRLIDTGGRVERFKKKQAAAQQYKAEIAKKQPKVEVEEEKKGEETLKQEKTEKKAKETKKKSKTKKDAKKTKEKNEANSNEEVKKATKETEEDEKN